MSRRLHRTHSAIAGYQVDLDRSDGYYYRIRLAGACDATVEYDARYVGCAVVRVNGRVVGRESSLSGYCPKFEFGLPAGQGSVPAVLEVRASLWSGILALRLRVGGTVLFAEDVYSPEASKNEAHCLPIPAPGPGSGMDGLPIPAPSAVALLQSLPRPASDPRSHTPSRCPLRLAACGTGSRFRKCLAALPLLPPLF